jgi:hypothetical protein
MFEALTISAATNMEPVAIFKAICGKFHVYIILTRNVRAESFQTGRVKLLDLPYLHVGIIPFKIFPFGTSYIAVSNTATPVSRCLSPPPAI